MRARPSSAGRGCSVEKALGIIVLWLSFAAVLVLTAADILRGLIALAARGLASGGAS